MPRTLTEHAALARRELARRRPAALEDVALDPAGRKVAWLARLHPSTYEAFPEPYLYAIADGLHGVAAWERAAAIAERRRLPLPDPRDPAGRVLLGPAGAYLAHHALLQVTDPDGRRAVDQVRQDHPTDDDQPGRWDGAAAMRRCSSADDPAACFAAICAGRRAGPADQRVSWALPHHQTAGGPAHPGGVRSALQQLPRTQGLTNEAEARRHLDAHQAEGERETAALVAAGHGPSAPDTAENRAAAARLGLDPTRLGWGRP